MTIQRLRPSKGDINKIKMEVAANGKYVRYADYRQECDELLEALRESLIIGSAYFNASHPSIEHPVLRDAAAILAKHQKGTDHAK